MSVTYSARWLAVEVVNGELLGPNLEWTTRLCDTQSANDRAHEASYLVRSGPDASPIVRVSALDAPCPTRTDGDASTFDFTDAGVEKRLLVSLTSTAAQSCTTFDGTSSEPDAGDDGSTDDAAADASTDAMDALARDAGDGGTDAQ